MSKISIFLGTSASLMELRTKIGSRIRQVNDALMPQGVQVVLNKWEDYKAEYTGDSKQLEYDRDLLLQSDIIVTVFKHHVGKWTAHELDVAIEDGKKVIYCYCLPCQEREEVVEKLKAKGLTPIEVESKAAVMDCITKAVNKYAQEITTRRIPFFVNLTSDIFSEKLFIFFILIILFIFVIYKLGQVVF